MQSEDPKQNHGKIAGKNCGFLVREIAAGTLDLKNFGFPDSGQGKGTQKLQVQTESKPSRKIFHMFELILIIFA